MATIKRTSAAGKASGDVEVDDKLFGVQPNIPVLHQVVTAQLAARRAGTQSTKTRAEVAGGGAKPWRQKGTGRARQGSIRSPQWRGGGVAHGPKPRSYKQRTPKKMIRLALASALSDRLNEDRLKVIDSWGLDAPSTKSAVKVLQDLNVEGRVLVVLTRDDEATWKSLRNLQDVHVLYTGELNAYDILVSDWVVFTEASLPGPRADDEAGTAPEAETEESDS
jgi:large subunit ribosomal protein L4